MSVLMICPQFRPIVGGYERAAERLSAALAAAGRQVVVVTERRQNIWPESEHIDGYEVRRLPCLYRRHLHATTSLLSFAAFLFKHGRRFDVWHVHQYGPHACLAVILGALLRRPVALKLTGSGPFGIRARSNTGILGLWSSFLHRRVSACIATSEETAQEAIDFGIPAPRVFRIPNGVDGEQFQPADTAQRLAARNTLGLNCRRLVLSIGRLAPEKNHLGLVEAWAKVTFETRSQCCLAIVGDGPELPRIRARVCELGISASVYLAGHRDDTPTWYAAADFYVISSLHEGLSNSMIEALACGLPIISTAVAGTTQYIRDSDAGHVVPVNDSDSLASAVQQLLTASDEILRQSRNARRVFEDNFSMSIATEKTCALYHGLGVTYRSDSP